MFNIYFKKINFLFLSVGLINGQSPYSASKIGADQIAYSFYASFNLPLVIARPFNNYGPRQSLRAIIPDLITQIASKKKQIRVGSVTPTRDFTFVEDTVSAYIAILESDIGLGEVFNIGSNFEISVGDTAHEIAKAMGCSIEIITDEQRLRPEKSEVERLWASNTKARELLGWQPQYAGREGFMRGIEETVAWFRDPANLAAYKANIYNL